MIVCTIDSREHDIINLIKDFKYDVTNLDIGDISFKRNETEICLIERKTIKDYASSILDKRNKEQVFRITEAKNNNKDLIVIYMIEGDIPSGPNKFEYTNLTGEAIFSSICNKMLRDKFFVYQTKNINDSIKFIKKIHEKLSENIDINNEHTEYSKTISLKKKDHMNPNIWFKLCLAQIPSVSIDMANVITDIYPTMFNLYNKYTSITEKESRSLLSNIMYGKRRLGDVVSNNVYEYFNEHIEHIENIEHMEHIANNQSTKFVFKFNLK